MKKEKEIRKGVKFFLKNFYFHLQLMGIALSLGYHPFYFFKK